jgi:hypothetical protein
MPGQQQQQESSRCTVQPAAQTDITHHVYYTGLLCWTYENSRTKKGFCCQVLHENCGLMLVTALCTATFCSLQASESRAAELCTELGLTRDELARAAAVASRAAAAEAKLVKGEGMVPAGAWQWV